MKSQQHGPLTTFACLLVALVVMGCASTKVTDRHRLVTERLPRPANIWVHDFVATAAEVPADSTIAREYTFSSESQSAEEIEAGRQLGRAVAGQLRQQIRDMGLPVPVVVGLTRPQVNDIVIRGYLVSVEEGSAAKRVVIGFGKGGSALCTAVEAFQVTPTDLRKLGYGTVQSGGSKTPGAALGVATFIATANPAGLIVSTGAKVYGEASGKSTIEGRAKATAKEIAKVLEARFQEQGWIK